MIALDTEVSAGCLGLSVGLYSESLQVSIPNTLNMILDFLLKFKVTS